MELINPHLVVNSSINDEYYCEKILEVLKRNLKQVLNEVDFSGIYVKFRASRFDFSIEYDKTKPINGGSIQEKINKILTNEYGGALEMNHLPKEYEMSRVVECSIRILDPYKILYTFYYEEFKSIVLKFLNSNINRVASKTTKKCFEFDLDLSCEYSYLCDFPHTYFVRLLEDLVNGNPNYSLTVCSSLRDYCVTVLLSWGDDKNQEQKEGETLSVGYEAEPKSLSYMDRIREYVKCLVNNR